MKLAAFLFEKFLKAIFDLQWLRPPFYDFFQDQLNLWISTEWKARPVIELQGNQKAKVTRHFGDKTSSTGFSF